LYVLGDGNIPNGCAGNTCDNRFDGSHYIGTLVPGAGYPVSGPTTQPVSPPTKDVVNSSGKGIANDGSIVSCSTNGTPVGADGCAGSDYNKKRQQDAGTYSGIRTAGIPVMIVGGVLIAGGIAWHFLEPTGPEKSAAKKKKNEPPPFVVAPVITPGYGGVALGATF
jgi:hypothetical protein